MYCSTQQFITIAKDKGLSEQDLFESLSVIKSLASRWGVGIKAGKIHEAIEKAAPEIASMIHLLESIGKADSQSVSALLTGLQGKVTGSFIVSGTDPERVTKKLEKSFGSTNVAVVPSEKIQLEVSGDGWRYKRGLDRDLDKILT